MEKSQSFSELKKAWRKKFGKKKSRLAPGVRRCIACRIGLLKREYFADLAWLPRRGANHPALCFKCINRLWTQLQGSGSGSPS